MEFKLRKINIEENTGTKKPGDHLFMVVWQRAANSGIKYVYAKSEEQALKLAGYNPEFVKHTVVLVSPGNPPFEVGVSN